MIHPDSRTLAWIEKVAKENNEKGITEVRHFSPESQQELVDAIIKDPLPTKFNKFKKSNVEAFFYWIEIQKLM